MHKYVKKYINKDWTYLPIFIFLLFASWFVVSSVMNIAKHFLGDVLMILTLPIYWYYIIGPILDELWDCFDNKDS